MDINELSIKKANLEIELQTCLNAKLDEFQKATGMSVIHICLKYSHKKDEIPFFPIMIIEDVTVELDFTIKPSNIEEVIGKTFNKIKEI